MADDIKYRWIDGPESHGPFPATEAEWKAIDDILVARGWMALNRVLTRILLAEDADERIVGFSVVQLIPNCGPEWVDKDHRGTGMADKLAADTIQFLLKSNCRGWIVVADTAHSERLAKAQGMVKLESPVYVSLPGDRIRTDSPHVN